MSSVRWSTPSDDRARAHAYVKLAALYAHIWVLEGAFRKWIPPLDSAFYVGRDGLVFLGMLFIYSRYGRTKSSNGASLLVWLVLIVGATWAILTAILTSMPAAVPAFGLRNYLAPVLLGLLLWREGASDVVPRLALILLRYAPFQAGLAMLQVASPRSSVINVQTGGEEAFFTTAGGVVRASGTFSAPAGLIQFMALALAFAIPTAIGMLALPRFWGWLGLLSVVATVTIGGSRGAVFASLFVIIGWLAHSLAAGRFKNLAAVIPVFALGFLSLLVAIALFPAVFDAFVLRFQNAAQDEDTGARLLRSIVGFLDIPFSLFGDGMGARSGSGVGLGSGYTWVEVDSERWVAELGVLGIVLNLLKMGLVVRLLFFLASHLKSLPLACVLLGSYLFQALVFGAPTSQPSSQGAFAIAFACFIVLAQSESVPDDSLRSDASRVA